MFRSRQFSYSTGSSSVFSAASTMSMMAPAFVHTSMRRHHSACFSSSFFLTPTRCLFATPAFTAASKATRNIGISAHIDSGKTTVSERILFYTGKIQAIHEVKGADSVGATMDSMELEKERGITIRSAATFCKWKDTSINLIDTPGHVDFTIEVERALRVLDGAIMLMCGVGAVQSQTLTVDRQMRRYSLPRIIFINKLDRDNASPQRCLAAIRERLGLHCAFLQLNIGIAHDFEGIVDIVEQRAVFFDGKNGEKLRVEPVPAYMQAEMVAARAELIAKLADVDPQMEELFLNEQQPTVEQIKAAIRRATIATKFCPIMMGSAYKNKGVQLLLDGVADYLPTPSDRNNIAHEMQAQAQDEEELAEAAAAASKGAPGAVASSIKWESKGSTQLINDDEKPLMAMMFKLEQTQRVGMANYVRVYQGRIRKGDRLVNVRTGKAFTIPSLVKMHSNQTEAVDSVAAGDICAIVGEINASSGDSFTRSGPLGFPCTEKAKTACENMYVPPRVISMSLKAKESRDEREGGDYLRHFMREDPTLHVSRNNETNELIIEGMGELHLNIYVERLKREFEINVTPGKPTVNYREVITKAFDYDFVYKRQSGGQGQWAHVKGRIEPMQIDLTREGGVKNRVVLKCSNGDVREALQKSFQKQIDTKIFPKGSIIGAPVWGVRVTLTGGAMHEVDSNDIAFRNAAQTLWDENLSRLQPTLVEPFMSVEITAPSQYLSDIQSEFTRRQGVLNESTVNGPDCVIHGEAALDTMFGFISDLRQLTKGQGEFSMEFKEYRNMPTGKAQEVADERNKILGRKPYILSE